jgi:hypothetical protein
MGEIALQIISFKIKARIRVRQDISIQSSFGQPVFGQPVRGWAKQSLSNIDQNINEIQPYACVLEPCRTAEEWEARADLEEATSDRPARGYLSPQKSGT